MTSGDVLREWRHHAEDLGWLAQRMLRYGLEDQAYAAAYCAAHYARCVSSWLEMQAGRRGCPQCADMLNSSDGDHLSCSDYEAGL
jgi:hypothetical protein